MVSAIANSMPLDFGTIFAEFIKMTTRVVDMILAAKY